VERESQELASRAAVDRETLATLQSDLVTQKLNTQQLRSSLEKIGLSLDQLMDPDVALEKYVIWLFEPRVFLKWKKDFIVSIVSYTFAFII
jgi:hypothetical protein